MTKRLIMNPLPRLVPIFFALLLGTAIVAAESREQAADRSAGKCLALDDGSQYQQSWQQAANQFKQKLSADDWQRAIVAARQPLGAMRSRKLLSATYFGSLPGAPDGDYVVLQYQTEFEHKQRAIETVTPMLDNGSWRVSGYYVR